MPKDKQKSKENKKIALVIMSAVVLVFSLGLLVKMPVKTSSTTNLALTVNTEISDDITYIHVTNQMDDYEVNVSRGNCSIEDLQNIPVVSKKFDDLLMDCSQIRALQLINEETYDLDSYGLKNPKTTVQIKYKDGTQTTLNIGNNAPMSAGVYVNLANTSRVYLFALDSTDSFENTKFDYINKDIVPKLGTSGNTMNISKATLTGGDRPNDLIISVGTDSENTTNYQVKSKGITADGEKTISLAIINELKNLTAESVEVINPTEDTLKNYGLNTPYASAILALDEKATTVLVSPVNSDGYMYIMNKATPVIYKISRDKQDWVNIKFEEIASKNIINDSITSLKSLEVKSDSNDYIFNINSSSLSGNVNIDSVTLNGNQINVENFKNFYQSVVSCKVDAFISEAQPVDSSPVLTYKFNYNDNERQTKTIDYFSNLDKTFVFKDGVCNSTVDLNYVNIIKGNLQKLLNNQTI